MSTTPPPTGNREFTDDVVRIAALTVNTNTVSGLTFSNCRMIGPAVVVFIGCEISHCTWSGSIDSMFWEVDPLTRPHIIGAVAFRDCMFSKCTFAEVGIAGAPEMRALLEAGTN